MQCMSLWIQKQMPNA